MSTNATYAVVSEKGNDFILFLGNGLFIEAKGFSIESGERTNAVLEYKNGEYYFTCDNPVTITSEGGKGRKIHEPVYQKIKL